MVNNVDENNEIINIKAEDIDENLTKLLENSSIFKKNNNVEIIRCIIFYTDTKNVISYKKYEIELTNNTLPKSELVALILENKKKHAKEFDLTGIYKFEINLQEDEIKNFCISPESYSFMNQYKSIQDIKFNPGIEIFNHANNVILFFTKKTKSYKRESNNNNKKNTRKNVKFSTPMKSQDISSVSNNKTFKNKA